MTTLIPKYYQGGTGSVNRPINEKLGEFISVKDFGAIGDGSTDDTAAITAAWAALTRGILFFPAGIYKTTSTLNFNVATNTTNHKGIYSENAIIKPYVTSSTGLQFGNDATQWSFSIEGALIVDMSNSTGATCVGVFSKGQAWGFQINNLTVTSSTGVGVKIIPGSYGGTWNNLNIVGCTSHGLVIAGVSPSSAVTTNQFNSAYIYNNTGYNIWAQYAQDSTFINLNTASGTAGEVYFDYCYSVNIIGGLIEGSGTGITQTNSKWNTFIVPINCPTEYNAVPTDGILFYSNRYPTIPTQYGFPVALANNGTQSLGSIIAFLFIQSSGAVIAAQFYLTTGTSQLIWQGTGTNFSNTKDNAATTNIYWDATTSAHIIQNKSGVTISYKLQYLAY